MPSPSSSESMAEGASRENLEAVVGNLGVQALVVELMVKCGGSHSLINPLFGEQPVGAWSGVVWVLREQMAGLGVSKPSPAPGRKTYICGAETSFQPLAERIHMDLCAGGG